MSIVPPIVPPSWFGGPDKVNDNLGKDEKVRLSEILRRNGFPANVARTQGAPVAMAESRGNPDAVNTDAKCSPDGDVAVGLMQICTIHKGTMGIPADQNAAIEYLKNPDHNADVAHQLWIKQGWGPWEAYTSGAYRRFLGQDPIITIKKGATSLPGDAVDAAGDVVDKALGPIDEIASAILSPSTWFRLWKGSAGAMLLLLGVAALVLIIASRAAKSPTGKAVTKTAGNVASVVPVGRAAKVAGKAKSAVKAAA